MSLRSCLTLVAFLVAVVAATNHTAAQERLQDSLLHSKLVDLLIEKPETPLTGAAEYANSLLPQYGLGYVLDALSWLEAEGIDTTSTTNLEASTGIPFKAGDRTLIGAIQGRAYEGACEERWLEIPAINITATTFEIIHRGERITVERPAKVWVESMKVLSPDQQSVLTEVFIPGQAGPSGVSSDGRGVLLYYPLAEGTHPWWSNVRRQYPETIGHHPYLLLEVRADGIRFVPESGPYATGGSEWLRDFPTPPDNAFLRRWRFLDSVYVVEFTGPCT